MMREQMHWLDIGIMVLYAISLIACGYYFYRRSQTSNSYMIAGQSIPAWAAGLSLMATYTSSISYIATPGQAFDSNWHPIIFALCIVPVAWITCRFAIPYYRKAGLISVYSFLETKLGTWARLYASTAFLLYMIGRMAVILYLGSLLLHSFIALPIVYIILLLGVITILYTLFGGIEAVIWTDVVQSIIMIVGILFVVAALSMIIFAPPEPLVGAAVEANKFSWGSWNLDLTSRTIWVMIIYGITENLRNLMADQNYVQRYATVATEADAKRAVWISMAIYIPLTAVFLYIGTALFAYYSSPEFNLPDFIDRGDQVFPYYISTVVPIGLKGLIIAAIIAAAMSTVDSALNCSSTVTMIDFYKRFFRHDATEKQSLFFLRLMTVLYGIVGTSFALLMIQAKSALDVWWQISGIFGGAILGLFILALIGAKLNLVQGLIAIGVSILVIVWGTFARNLPEGWGWAQASIDPIIIGAMGTAALLIVCYVFHRMNKRNAPESGGA